MSCVQIHVICCLLVMYVCEHLLLNTVKVLGDHCSYHLTLNGNKVSSSAVRVGCKRSHIQNLKKRTNNFFNRLIYFYKQKGCMSGPNSTSEITATLT